jgi:hypothetical protein
MYFFHCDCLIYYYFSWFWFCTITNSLDCHEKTKWLGEFVPVDANSWVANSFLFIGWKRLCPILDVYFSYTSHLFMALWQKLALIWHIGNELRVPEEVVKMILYAMMIPAVVIVEQGFLHYFPLTGPVPLAVTSYART